MLQQPFSTYIGRFAPSPTGPLHMGSLIAAMASYLDAKAHHGKWLVRIEDTDFDRNVKGADHAIIATLQRCGMQWDGDITWQSQRTHLYEAALKKLVPWTFECTCSRKEIADSRLRLAHTADLDSHSQTDHLIYLGTCRYKVETETDIQKPMRAIRLRVPEAAFALIEFEDRLLGKQQQNIATEVGDFVLKRADGFWAYQLAVVVDDAAQGITHIVRGEDLLDSTARQLYLQRLLQLPTPTYLHIPVLNNEAGEKLSKQTGVAAFDDSNNDLLQDALLPAAAFLGLSFTKKADNIAGFWELAIAAWAKKIENLSANYSF